jgi:integrase
MQTTLVWRAKVASGKWRYFRVLLETVHGVKQVHHGWVREKGRLVEYSQGAYYLRTHEDGKRKYTPLATCNPRDAYLHWQTAQKRVSGFKRNPRTVIRTAVPLYIRYLEKQKHLEAMQQSKVVLREFSDICNSAGIVLVRSITEDTLLDYHEWLGKRDQSERTIANKDQRVRSFIKWCNVGLDMKSLGKPPKYERKEPNIYTREQVSALLNAADPYMKMVIGLCLHLALREGEMMHAAWSNVDFTHGTYTVRSSPEHGFLIKDKEERTISVPTSFLSELRAWKESRTGELIVGNKEDQPQRHLLRRLQTMARNAGLKPDRDGWTLHRFRRTGVTAWLRIGIDVATVMKLASHSDMATTLRYLKSAESHEIKHKVDSIVWS